MKVYLLNSSILPSHGEFSYEEVEENRVASELSLLWIIEIKRLFLSLIIELQRVKP